MKIQFYKIVALLVILMAGLTFTNVATAGVTVDASSIGGDYGAPAITNITNDLQGQLSDVWDEASVLSGDAFAISNYSTSLIGGGKLSAFTVGVMFSPTFATKANMIDSGMKDGLGAAKGGAINVGVLFGLSLGSSMDLVINGTYLPKAKWLPKFDKFEAYGGGIKLRFKIIGEATAIGTGFGGLILSVGAGYSKMKLAYSQDLNQEATYDVSGYTGTLTFNTFGGDLEIKTFYAGADIKVFFKVLSFLNLYGGIGVIYSNTNINVSAEGNATNEVNSISKSGLVTITGDAKSNHFIPEIMAGVCFNILMIKIPIQLSMTWSPNNKSTPIWNLTAGVRIEL